MGRAKEISQNRVIESQSPSQPAPIDIFRAPETSSGIYTVHLDKYGYKNPRRQELKSRLESIIKDGPKKVVTEALERYKDKETDEDGKKLVASIVTQGYEPDLNDWLTDQNSPTLNGDTKTSAVRLAVAVDFANQMEKAGNNDEDIRRVFGERQSKLGSLSLWTALQRVAPKHLGLLHEVAEEIAQGDAVIVTKRDKKIMGKFEKKYTLREDDRGH